MTFKTTNCVALGAPDIEEAASFYERVLGFGRQNVGTGWIELQSGALRIFITKDDGTAPTFDLSVEDVEASAEYLLANGFTKLGEGNGEVYVRDPFGTAFALSIQAG